MTIDLTKDEESELPEEEEFEEDQEGGATAWLRAAEEWVADFAGRLEEEGGRLGGQLRPVVSRVGAGSGLLARLATVRVVGWCRAGHRDDLTGIAARLGVYGRAVVVAGGGYGAWVVVQGHHVVMWPLVGSWVLGTLVVTRRRSDTAPAPAPTAPAGPPVEAAVAAPAPTAPAGPPVEAAVAAPAEPPVVALVRAEIGTDTGVHLADLYPAMRASLPGLSEADDTTLRAVLTGHHLRTRRTVRARGVAGRSGVHRKDLPPLPSPRGVPDPLSTPLSTHGDAGQSTGAESGGDARRGPESAIRMVQDPDNPARWHVTPA